MTDFNPDDPTGEIRRATLLAMSYLERRGKRGGYDAIKVKVTAWMKELDDCGQLVADERGNSTNSCVHSAS